MTTVRRTVAAVTAAILALAGATACSAADRAVLTAPSCSDATASPTPPRNAPGQAYLLGQVVRSSLPPGPVAGWEDVVSVADAGTTLAAVHPDGTVSVVGVDHEGLLAGTGGGAQETLVPRTVPGIADALSVAAVSSTFVVTHTDGTMTAWGEAFLASGGDRGPAPVQPVPSPVPGVSDVVSAADGSLTTLALRSDGSVLGWGINLTQILGERDGTAVREIRDVPGAVSVANAGGAAVVATGVGEVCAWGNNVHGLLGVEPRGGQTPGPVRVEGLEEIVQVAGGNDFALALDSRGDVRAWGRTAHGTLGDGTAEDTAVATPRVVPGLPPLRWIGAAESASYGIDTSGALWAWGRGPLRAADPVPDTVPRQIPLPGPAQHVSGAVVLLGGS